MDKLRLNFIDVLKGICMIFVVLVHAGGGEWQGNWAILGNQGAYLVYFLLIISGYLTWKSIDNRNMSLSKWFILRFIKLMPLWYISIIISIIRFNPIDYLSKTHNVCLVIINLLFLNGLSENYHSSIVYFGWYIGALTFCYIWTVVLHTIIKNKESLKVLVIIELAIYSLGICLQKIFEAFSIHNVRIERICIWITIYTLGIVAYYIEKEVYINDKFWIWLIGVFGFIFLIGEARYLNGIWLFKNGLFRFAWCYFLIFIFFLYQPIKTMNLPLLSIIGRNSLVVYLFHYYPLEYFPWGIVKIKNIVIMTTIKSVITIFLCMCFAYIYKECTHLVKKVQIMR